MSKKLPPVHPGEVLREEFLLPLNLSSYAVSKAIGVPRTRIERLAREEVALTADTALRLGAFFGTTPAFWLGIQMQFDLERAADEARGIECIKPISSAAELENLGVTKKQTHAAAHDQDRGDARGRDWKSV